MAHLRIGLAAFLALVASTAAAQSISPARAASSPGMPGLTQVIFKSVTPEESERAIHSRPVPPGLNQPLTINPDTGAPLGVARAAAAAPVGPNSIPELARALKNDVDLIYEYVRNNIEYYPIWGVQKAAGAILDNQGTAFDQAALMVALLREAGYTTSYILGGITLSAAQLGAWLGVDTGNACAVKQFLSNGQIPIKSLGVPSPVNCDSPSPPVPLINASLSHVWVKVNISGTNYYFDPSYKPHTLKSGIDLAAVTGYNSATYLTQARSGATITGDYVQGINRANIRNNLASYAITLASYLRTNYPAGVLEDVVGGKTIVPYAGAPLRQTSLPYQDMSVALTEWTGYIPVGYKPTLQIKHLDIDVTYQSHAIYGRRLTLTYNSSDQPVLMLDGTVLATGATAVTRGTVVPITFTIIHPAYVGTDANETKTQKIKAGGTYVISNGWGPAGRGPVDQYRKQLDEARTAGSADTSEVVMGSSLAVLSSTWIAQSDTVAYVADRLAKTNTLFHHQVGVAGYYDSSYVDLPANAISVSSQSNDIAKAITALFNLAGHLSILESTAVQQTSSVTAVSTVKLVDIASTNNYRIYNATSSNYASVVRPSLVACSSDVGDFDVAIAANNRLILPDHCNLGENSWSGTGYFKILPDQSSISALISGNLKGGFSSFPQLPAPYVSNTFSNSLSPAIAQYTIGRVFGEPIDMKTGNYLYNSDDMKVGVGSYPHALTFQKIYSSGARTQKGPLGMGWGHNFDASTVVSSDGFQGMGEDSALDAANTLVEQMVSLDLLTDTAKPLDKLVIATLGQRWYGDQLVDNTVIVRQGLNGEVFVKLPDGTYNPPPANSAKLTKNGDSSYTYETVNRDKLNFNPPPCGTGSNCKIATYNHASGVQVKFTYSGADLTQVQNSLGRTLTLTNTSGRVTAVGDGSRSIDYAYDGSGNLSTFTDAAGKSTTFQYDLPGRMTKLFYPANPTLATITNVYDTLGRIQTQTNVHNYLYTYYFAGSRSEEVGPDNISNVSYIDGSGKVYKSINPKGKITTNAYDGQTRLAKTTLSEGNSVAYTYDDATCASADKRCTHNVKTTSNIAKPGSGLTTLVTSMTYESAFNKVATATDPKGYVTDFTYTAQGEPLTITRPADALGVRSVSTYAYVSYTPSGYPALYLPSSVTEKTSATNSVVTATTYNTGNKYVPLTVTVDSGTGKLNLATTFTYNAIGDLTVVNGPRTDVSDITTTAYDNQRRPTQVTDALGKLTKYAYDANGNRTRTSAQIGTQWLVSCNTYTTSDKVMKAWGPGQTASDATCPTAAAPVRVTDYTYGIFDTPARITENLTAGEGGNRTTEYLYHADGRLYSDTRAIGTATRQLYAYYFYTNNGQLNIIRDGKNNQTTYQYDGHDRLAKTLYPDKTTPGTSSATDYEQLGYDANSNVTSLRGRNGQSTTLAYDNLNRLVGRSYPTTADNVTFSYDLLNRRIASGFADSSHAVTNTWDNAGRLISVAISDPPVGTKTFSYQYDAAGNRTRLTWPETTPFYVTTSFDALNRPTGIKELGTTDLATYAYDDLSRRATVTLGNGTTTTYGYNTQSALLTLTHNLAATAQDNTWTYARNQAQEIVTNTAGNNAYQWAGYANGTRSYTANGLNQYTAATGATPAYDSNGNLAGDGTWTYTYDQDNRLRSANKTGQTFALTYDALGRLRHTTKDTFINSDLLYDGTDVVGEYASGGLIRRYVHGPGIDEPLVWYEGSGTGSKTWLYADHQGSIAATANSAGTSTATYTYGPYGEPNATSGIRFRYTGQYFLGEIGLYYYKARFYSPTLGRFLQTDPVGYQSDLNLYAYVGNDPVNLTDPAGEFIVGALLGAGLDIALQLNANGADFSNLGLADLNKIDIRSVAIAAAFGAVAPGYINVAKTVATSVKAAENLLSQAANAKTADRLTKIGSRIGDNGNKAANVVAAQGGFQIVKSLAQAANEASSNSRAVPSSNSSNAPLPISGSSSSISNASPPIVGSSSSNFGLPVKMGPIK